MIILTSPQKLFIPVIRLKNHWPFIYIIFRINQENISILIFFSYIMVAMVIIPNRCHLTLGNQRVLETMIQYRSARKLKVEVQYKGSNSKCLSFIKIQGFHFVTFKMFFLERKNKSCMTIINKTYQICEFTQSVILYRFYK